MRWSLWYTFALAGWFLLETSFQNIGSFVYLCTRKRRYGDIILLCFGEIVAVEFLGKGFRAAAVDMKTVFPVLDVALLFSCRTCC